MTIIKELKMNDDRTAPSELESEQKDMNTMEFMRLRTTRVRREATWKEKCTNNTMIYKSLQIDWDSLASLAMPS